MVLCPRSGSHRKVKQNDKLRPVQDVPWLCSRSQPGIKVIIRDLRGHLLHTVIFLVSIDNWRLLPSIFYPLDKNIPYYSFLKSSFPICFFSLGLESYLIMSFIAP